MGIDETLDEGGALLYGAGIYGVDNDVGLDQLNDRAISQLQKGWGEKKERRRRRRRRGGRREWEHEWLTPPNAALYPV